MNIIDTNSSKVLNSLPLDVNIIKNDFPIFANQSKEKPFIYLDNAATSQTPTQVINSVNEYYYNYNSNVHRSIYSIGDKATEAYEKARRQISRFIGAKDSHTVIFTKGTTESINLIAYAWGLKNLKANDEILLTEMEHHSNLVPWQIIAKLTGANLKFIPFTKDGNLLDIEKYFNKNTKIVSFIHQSNVFGTINDVEKILDHAKSVGAITFLDGAQSIPHLGIDISSIDCDFVGFSGHKMLGPTGVGVLCGRNEILNEMEPFLGGGEMIQSVNLEKSSWNQIPWKFEAGTPNIAQAIGLGSAVKYISNIGIQKIKDHESTLTNYALKQLAEIDKIIIYGSPKNRGGLITFNIDGIHPHDVAQLLDEDGIAVRAGHHCAQPIMNKLNVSATVRISFYLYNDINDIDSLAESLLKTIKFMT
tara:strand:+ start:34220 stop:35476 length:1257 start_codon:yes stop_codon:yes gene_type:complete